MSDARKASFRLWLGALGLSASLLASRGVASEPAEKILPANTIFVAKIENMTAFRTGFNTSQFGQLLTDPAMKPFLDKLGSVFEQSDEQLKQEIGMTAAELFALPQGQVFLSVSSQPGEKLPFAVLVSADAGDNATRVHDLFEKLGTIAEQQGATVAAEESDGLTLHYIKNKSEPDAPSLIWSQSGSSYYFSTSADAIKDVVAHAAGRDNSLASTQSFTAVASKLGADAQLAWYLDVQQVLELGAGFASQNGVDAETVSAQITQLGLTGLKAIGGRVDFNSGEFDSVSRSFVYAPAPVSGLLKLAALPAQDLTPESWVPATVANYQCVSLDFDEAWKAITEIADSYAPGILAQVEEGLAAQNGGLKFKEDLIAPLARRITTISDFKKPITDSSQRAVVAIALDDSKATQNTLNKIFALAQATPKQRSFQGTTIYDFDVPPEMAASGIAGPISVTIAKDQLFLSFEPTLLEQILRGGYPALAESPEFQVVRKYCPSQVSLLTYDRPEDSTRAFYGMLGNEQFREAFNQIRFNPNSPSLGEVLDPTLLPEFSVIEKYLSPQGGYAVQGEDGVLFTQFTTRKSN